MKTLVTFIKKNPAILTRYVGLGVTLVDKAVSPLNKLMSHLLEVQGIALNTEPGDRERKDLIHAMNQEPSTKEYDDGFDPFAYRNGKFKKVSTELKDLNLTMDKFHKLTDLTHLSDKPLQLAVSPPPKKAEPDPLQELADFAERYNILGFEDVALKIKEHADKTPAAQVAPSRPVQISRSRQTTKSKPKAIKTFKKGVFRRVEGK